jgi:hypothetical protein
MSDWAPPCGAAGERASRPSGPELDADPLTADEAYGSAESEEPENGQNDDDQSDDVDDPVHGSLLDA